MSNGITLDDGHFIPDSYLEKLGYISIEKADREKKRAAREAATAVRPKRDPEAEQAARLERLRTTSYPADGPRYFMTKRGWSWHVFENGRWVDTGKPIGRAGTSIPARLKKSATG